MSAKNDFSQTSLRIEDCNILLRRMKIPLHRSYHLIRETVLRDKVNYDFEALCGMMRLSDEDAWHEVKGDDPCCQHCHYLACRLPTWIKGLQS